MSIQGKDPGGSSLEGAGEEVLAWPDGLPCLAYGSNLDDADLEAWVRRRSLSRACVFPFRDALGPVLLPDHAPAFTYLSASRGGGVLDVVPRRGHAVPGILFDVTDGGWETLDRKEGCPFACRRLPVTVLDPAGVERTAVTYALVPEQRDPSGFVAPTEEYLTVVRRGLSRHRLADTLLRAAAEGGPHAGRLNALFVYGTLLRGFRRRKGAPITEGREGTKGPKGPKGPKGRTEATGRAGKLFRFEKRARLMPPQQVGAPASCRQTDFLRNSSSPPGDESV